MSNPEVLLLGAQVFAQKPRALPLHHTQREVETGEWYSVFEYRMKPTFDLKQELLSRGDAVEVLSPQSLRDEMQEEIINMYNLYRYGI